MCKVWEVLKIKWKIETKLIIPAVHLGNYHFNCKVLILWNIFIYFQNFCVRCTPLLNYFSHIFSKIICTSKPRQSWQCTQIVENIVRFQNFGNIEIPCKSDKLFIMISIDFFKILLQFWSRNRAVSLLFRAEKNSFQ